MSFQALEEVLGSKIKALEVLCVLKNVKPVARLLCFEPKLGELLAFFEQLGLCYSVSSFKVIKERSTVSQYTESSVQVPVSDEREGHFFVYISLDKEKAEQARDVEKQRDHRQLGKLLGYPSCCCDFFVEKFEPSHTDLTLDSLKNSSGFTFDHRMNICARHVDCSLLNHFPHDFSCEPSLDYAKRALDVLKEHDAKAADVVISRLKTAVLYTHEHGVHLFSHFQLKDDMLYFDKVESSVENDLFLVLSVEKKLFIKNKHCVQVGTEEFNDVGLMVFI